jgi:deoxyribodipyrimidine photo-lyase
MTALVWFRQDLRLGDNPALAAAATHKSIVPLYVLDDTAPHPLGGAGRWWLHHSLSRLSRDLGGLLFERGDPREIVPSIAARAGATTVYWNRCYEPHAVARDKALKAALKQRGLEVNTFNASLLNEPWEVLNSSGEPFKVFTPFWRACRQRPIAPPQKAARPTIQLPEGAGRTLESLELLPRKPNWAAGWEKLWTPGEAGAIERLRTFLDESLTGYRDKRDRPDMPSTSRLSPQLHFGEISPRQIWAALAPHATDDAEKFASELGWREFCHHLLFHFPSIPEQNWRSEFDAFPWRVDAQGLKAWQRGLTGYPLVDAGMRELWQTGWMHNRVRMITASFLVKDLRIHWREGEAWFWDTLLDANLANNASGWQWVAGSGADASPYFRIFNPVTQGEKFDPDGSYVRRFCPELGRLPNEYIHAPFLAPPDVLAQARVKLGTTYPAPIVDHARARNDALAALQKMRALAAERKQAEQSA